MESRSDAVQVDGAYNGTKMASEVEPRLRMTFHPFLCRSVDHFAQFSLSPTLIA